MDDWPQIPDHLYRALIIGDSKSGKTNLLFNLINLQHLINWQPDIDKIYLCAKDTCEVKFQFLINKQENTGLKHFNGSKTFTEYSNDMAEIYKNTEETIRMRNVKY